MGDTVQLHAVVHWTDGTAEDVTPICRYQSNDDAMAKVDQNGVVTCLGKGDTQIVGFYDNGITPVPVFLAMSDLVGARYPRTPVANRIDELVLNKLKKLGITQSPVCDDAAFLRRASIDATGTLPSPAEVRAFLADHSSDKRQRKIDQLLNRPAYAAWWATRLCDLTGDNGTKILWLDAAVAARQWYEWLYDRMRRNEPYDKLVADLLLSTSHSPDESYEHYCARWHRTKTRQNQGASVLRTACRSIGREIISERRKNAPWVFATSFSACRCSVANAISIRSIAGPSRISKISADSSAESVSALPRPIATFMPICGATSKIRSKSSRPIPATKTLSL